jgi:hypothetical protein
MIVNNMPIDNLVVIYTGDPTMERKKKCGLDLMNQLFISANSIRNNWSNEVEIIFIHTKELSNEIREKLSFLKVKSINSKKKISASFPISNKMLVGEIYTGSKDILFLDCDTIIHRGLNFPTSCDMLVAYDALQDVSDETYAGLYRALHVQLPSGKFSEHPSFDYYLNNSRNLFPLINSGVYFIKNNIKDIFYSKYIGNFYRTYDLFSERMNFYFDQICFALTMHELNIDYGFFPKGYNFICTQRAPYLKNWTFENIYIEHYAGDSGRPLVFKGNKIDLRASGLLIR